jgi:hypothetical protein
VTKAIEDEVFVDLVGNGDHVMFHAQVADDQKFLFGEYPARWVVRRIEQHRLGLLLKRAFKFFGVEAVVRWTQRNPDRNASSERNTGMVILVRRLKNHDSLAGIDDT